MLESDQSEFIAIYGRRRVGKTFLITHLFRDRFAFSYSGLYLDNDEGGKGLTPAKKRKIQIARFIEALRDHGFCFEEKPKDWFEAFDLRRKTMVWIRFCSNKGRTPRLLTPGVALLLRTFVSIA